MKYRSTSWKELFKTLQRVVQHFFFETFQKPQTVDDQQTISQLQKQPVWWLTYACKCQVHVMYNWWVTTSYFLHFYHCPQTKHACNHRTTQSDFEKLLVSGNSSAELPTFLFQNINKMGSHQFKLYIHLHSTIQLKKLQNKRMKG